MSSSILLDCFLLKSSVILCAGVPSAYIGGGPVAAIFSPTKASKARETHSVLSSLRTPCRRPCTRPRFGGPTRSFRRFAWSMV